MDRLLFARENLLDTGSRWYVSGLFDRHAGRGLDGSTHARLVSLADRSALDIWATIWVNRLWVRILIRSMQFSQSRIGSGVVW